VAGRCETQLWLFVRLVPLNFPVVVERVRTFSPSGARVLARSYKFLVGIIQNGGASHGHVTHLRLDVVVGNANVMIGFARLEPEKERSKRQRLECGCSLMLFAFGDIAPGYSITHHEKGW
jgi:hypothetical protein